MKKDDVKIWAALATAIINNPQTMKIPWYRRAFWGSLFSGTTISRSKYKPHQSDREKTRRLQQIERGILKP